MSILHSSRAPWLMLIAFTFCAMTFFSLAVGRDVGLVAALFNPESPVTLKDEVQRLVTRWWEDDRTAPPAPEQVEQARADMPPASPTFRSQVQHPPPAVSPPEPPAPSPEPARADEPGRLLSHSFSQVESGFQGGFRADRPVPQPRHFFLGDPARWVVDIPGNWRNMARFNNTIDTGFIRQVVLGEHDGYLRIVFHFRNRDMSRPASPPAFSHLGDSLTVTIARPDDDG